MNKFEFINQNESFYHETDQLAKTLEHIENPEEKQQKLDQVFSDERRKSMLSQASEDTSGRKVLYYRKMGWENFLSLLRHKEQSAYSYHDANKPVNAEEFKNFLISFFDLYYTEQKYNNISAYDLLRKEIPHAIKQINALEKNSNYQNTIEFVKQYLDQEKILKVHTGSLYQKYSPYLSLSVGGIISIPRNRVYIECVLPDDKVIVHKDAVQGEKEVLTTNINTNEITKVYVSPDKLISEVVENPTSNIGQFAKKNNIKSPIDAIESWRWEEDAEAYLPEKLINNK